MSRLEELSGLWVRRGLPKLARKLSRRLAADYGVSANYTADQLNAAMNKSSAPERLRAFGFAAFLDREAYADLATSSNRAVDYDFAKKTFSRAVEGSASAYAFSPNHGDYSSIVQPPTDGF